MIHTQVHRRTTTASASTGAVTVVKAFMVVMATLAAIATAILALG